MPLSAKRMELPRIFFENDFGTWRADLWRADLWRADVTRALSPYFAFTAFSIRDGAFDGFRDCGPFHRAVFVARQAVLFGRGFG